MLRRIIIGAIVAILMALARPVVATSFTDVDPPTGTGKTQVVLHGALRTRFADLYNLDLDRGTTPSGLPLFPVPADDPTGQNIYASDMRLRFDGMLVSPGGGFDVKVRADVLNDISLGSTPVGVPAASTSQEPSSLIAIERAYGEAFTPFGVLAAGRMGNDWGLGMLANGGDCADCDSSDSVDRVAFLTPLLGHIFAVAYDFSATLATAREPDAIRWIDLAPSTDVRTFTFAFLKWRSPRSVARRRAAGRVTFDYGAFVSHRTQPNDVPTSYLPVATPTEFSSAQIVQRDYQATTVDGWLRLVSPFVHVELEAAYLNASIGQTSLLPGVLLRGTATSNQLGAALESEVGGHGQPFHFGLDAGYASGDPAPGFGAYPGIDAPAPQPGELDGPQASYPNDLTVDNFRFHPDYRIDQILFHEIIGTVTDAIYVRPHLRWRLFDAGPSSLTFTAAVIASWAVDPSSTPSGQRPLGVEIDPSLVWAHRDGFSAVLDTAYFQPFSAFDNPVQHLTAKPAALARLRLVYGF